MAIGLSGYNCNGKRRVFVSNNGEASPPLKRLMCSDRTIDHHQSSSHLEALPQEILVHVLCGVDHEDLKQLFHVSKTIREATLIAKGLHFEFTTPKKKNFASLTPKAPLKNPWMKKSESRLKGRNFSEISMGLFASMDEQE